ncbi:MAG: tetratricopeptide repeat protein [Myxococcota bacterium]
MQRLLEQFAVDPGDTPAFRTLEEHLFFVEAWQQLAGVYECRISATAATEAERERLLLRLASVLDERLGDVEGARGRLEELLRQNPEQAEGLAYLRRLHTRTGELTAALQLAEIEERLPLRAADRAKVLAEIAALWNRAGDSTEGERRIEEALRLDPACDLALAERARRAAETGRNEEALRVHAQRVKSLVGAARCDVLAQMVELLPPAQKDRIRTLLREIVRQFPDRREPLERLIELELEDRDYEQVDELQRALWKTLRSSGERVGLALEAATLHLGEAADLEAAFYWADLANETAPDDCAVQELRSRLFRRAAQTDNLIETLEKLVRIDGATSRRLLELAVLNERQERLDQAVEWLARLLERDPTDAEALDTLDRLLANLGRHADRVEVLERRAANARSPAEAADLFVELAELCSGPLADAVAGEEAYRRALERADHAPAAEGLRQLLSKSERFKDLARLLEQLAGREDHGGPQAELLTELGGLRLDSLDDPAGAHAAFSRALDANAEAHEALEGLRRVAEAGGAPAALLEACQREIDLEPELPRRVELLREIIEVARAAGDLPRVRGAAEAWKELETSTESLSCLAELGRELGDEACERAALESLEALLADDPPERARTLARLGELALEQANPNALEAACHWYREALVVDPGEGVRCRLIDLYRTAGQLPELVHELRVRLDALEGEEAIACRVEIARSLRELSDLGGAVDALWPAFEDEPARAETADLLEEVLAEQGRAEQLCEVLGRRLAHEREAECRRAVAERLATLLLDRRGRSADAAAVLRELADPSRDDVLEQLFERALAASSVHGERESWLRSRESHVSGERQGDVLQRLAATQEEAGRRDEAIESLRRAHTLLTGEGRAQVQGRLLSLLRGVRSSQEQLDLLAELLDETENPEARATFLIERARIQTDDLDSPQQAIGELERAEQEGALGPAELGLVSSLYARAGAVAQQASALGALAEATDDRQERRQALLRLGALRLDGPEAARDLDEAETALRRVLELDPADGEAFDRLLALYDERLRSSEVCELLKSRLALPELRPSERSSLTLRLATLQMELGQPASAADTVRAARAAGIDRPALNELLFSALEATGQTQARAKLADERARAESGADRARWLRRWLEAHESSGDRPDERLQGVEELLTASPGDPGLVALRLGLLRQLDRLDELAAALEDVVRGDTPLPDGRRAACLRELLQLCEGPLDRSERALAVIEAETDPEPVLLLRGADLASRLGDPAREAALLAPMVRAAGASPTPDCVRRLGLALWRSSDPAGAEDPLWRAHSNDPRDREVLEALQSLLVGRRDPDGLLQLLDARFALEAGETRTAVAREGLALAEDQGQSEPELRWVRRLQSLAPLSAAQRERWLSLEHAVGDRPGALFALNTLRESAESPAEAAELLASEAAIQVECGQLGLAHEAYAEAIELSASPPAEWLRALEGILKSRGHTAERAEILYQLSGHPDLSADQQEAHLESRFALLASDPELCDVAAAELRSLELSKPNANPAIRIGRMRQLLDAYEELDRIGDWCALAEQLVPLLSAAERSLLERRIAARLAHPLCDTERATAAWEAILSGQPHDAEALQALATLLRRPAAEARLAEVLERWADWGAPDPVACWLEAGQLRWRELRDAVGALADANRALERTPGLEQAHALRLEVSAHLNRSADETASLEALLAADPDGAEAAQRWLRLAQIKAVEPESRSVAREAALRALSLLTDSVDLRSQVRGVLERLGAWPEAAEVVRAEVELADEEQAAPLLRRLARISWDELHEPSATADALEALAERVTLAAEEHARWAEALEQLERWPEALERLRQGLEAGQERVTPGAWLDLARQVLEKLDNAAQARQACDQALELDPDDIESLSLHAELCARLGDPDVELDDRVRLADLLSDDRAAARAGARAASLIREHLGDLVRAQNLYRSALRRDGALVPALLGAGEIALETGEWDEAERRLGAACSLLPDSDLAPRLADTACGAATAAAQLQRHAEAFRYLELALQREPRHPAALDAMTELSLRLGAYERARDCLEARISDGDLDEDTRADRLVQLAQAYEGSGQPEEAARMLEQILSIRPHDEVTRARAVDLLEQLGEHERAIEQVVEWIERSPTEFAPRLELRAARLEISIGRREEARRRLQRLTSGDGAPTAAWVELAELALADVGPDDVLALTRRGLDRVDTPSERAALLWVETRVLEAQQADAEAATAACETLRFYPGNVECARLLAAKLPLPIDREQAVEQIERALDTGNASPAVEAELWEAIGRAYSGPLQDIERAQLCYRRALESNPQRSSTREALADTSALDPASHRESIRLHERLLAEFPARPGSWNAIQLIAEHWKRDRSRATAEAVLVALGLRTASGAGKRTRILVDAEPSILDPVRGACHLLQALGVAGEPPPPREEYVTLSGLLATEIEKIAGPLWSLPNEDLRAIWRAPSDRGATGQRTTRRTRRRVRRALEKLELAALGELETEVWRSEVLAEAAARLFDSGRMDLSALLACLLTAWAETSHLDTGVTENLGAAIQICPPARGLLLRIASAAIEGLGLS